MRRLSPPMSLSSTHAPLRALLAAIAARTSRIRLGSAVTVLSSDDPIRVFQRFSTLNALSNGRAEPILGRDAKVQALEEISARLGISPADAVAVGDGANDLGMLGLAGMGVALHAKPSVQAECAVRVNHGDLTALLYLQGYRRDEFLA